MDLQRGNLAAFQPEDELKVNRTAGEIPGKPIGNDGLAVLLNGFERLDCVLILLLCLRLPLLDIGQALEGLAPVSHDSMLGEAPR